MDKEVFVYRAIGGEFAKRKLKQLTLLIGIPSVIILLFSFWLVSISAWWLLFAVPIFLFVAAELIVYVFARMMILRVTPKMTHTNQQDVAAFVDKLERVSEQTQTPPFMVAFFILRDLMLRKNRYVKQLTDDTKTIHTDFLALRRKLQK